MLTQEAPLLGISARAPDGVENVAVFPLGTSATSNGAAASEQPFMLIFSEGLKSQHLALAVSRDLLTWSDRGPLYVAPANWTAGRFGAPHVWVEGDCYWMALMGEYEVKSHRSAIGLLHSMNGHNWTMLPERTGPHPI